MKIIREITLDVSKQGVQASVPLIQHDSGIYYLLIHLRNGAKEVKLSGLFTATLWVSNDTYEPVTLYTEDSAYPNTLECNISPYVTKDAGEFKAQLQIHEYGNKMVSAPEFMFSIRKDISGNSEVLTGAPFQAVAQAELNARQAANDAVQAKNEILATAGDLNAGLRAILAIQEELKNGGIADE